MDTVLVDRCNIMTFIPTVGGFSWESWFLHDGDSGETPSLFKLIEILAFIAAIDGRFFLPAIFMRLSWSSYSVLQERTDECETRR